MNFHPSESMVGLEREILLVAHDNAGRKYNLAMSREVIDILFDMFPQDHRIRQYCKDGWVIVPEYSVSLIEIVSPPIRIALFTQLVDILENIQQDMASIVQSEIYSHYPQLNSYIFSIETEGTSEVNEYLLPTGEIVSDASTNTDYLLLEADTEFADKVRGHMLVIGNHTEEGVGIYNHLSSTHVTFQPEYGENISKNRKKYIQFLFHLEKIVISYKAFDTGNKRILRDGAEHSSSKNIRDLFLASMLELRYKLAIPIAYHAGLDITEEIERLNVLAHQIAAAHDLDIDLIGNVDNIFRKWSSINYRPRLTKEGLPLIEVRAFGSNFDLQVLKQFVEHIRLLDTSFDTLG